MEKQKLSLQVGQLLFVVLALLLLGVKVGKLSQFSKAQVEHNELVRKILEHNLDKVALINADLNLLKQIVPEHTEKLHRLEQNLGILTETLKKAAVESYETKSR